MAYDEKLADRVRKVLGKDDRVTERKMFGGIAFMLNGNMFQRRRQGRADGPCRPRRLRGRAVPSQTREMDFTGRRVKGMLNVSTDGITGQGLKTWIDRCLRFAESLPPKR